MAKKEKAADGLTPLARRRKEALGEGKTSTVGAPSVDGAAAKPARKRAAKKKR